ncbi:Bud site selection protein, Revert to axial protein 1 [Podila humilis]|nr:Bud site selection protein, Revert to axial protein 1 [Podila humilis]
MSTTTVQGAQIHTSSISNSTGSSQSRKPQLEAIQTKRAQASVTFRPVSSTSSGSYYDGSSSGHRPTSGISTGSEGPSGYLHPQHQHQHQQHHQTISDPTTPPPATASTLQATDEHGKVVDTIPFQYYTQDLDPLPPSSTLSSFPFTPSTLVDSVPSPVESEQQYPPTSTGSPTTPATTAQSPTQSFSLLEQQQNQPRQPQQPQQYHHHHHTQVVTEEGQFQTVPLSPPQQQLQPHQQQQQLQRQPHQQQDQQRQQEQQQQQQHYEQEQVHLSKLPLRNQVRNQPSSSSFRHLQRSGTISSSTPRNQKHYSLSLSAQHRANSSAMPSSSKQYLGAQHPQQQQQQHLAVQQLQQDNQLQLQQSQPQQQQLQQQRSTGALLDLTYSTSSDDSRARHLPNLWQVLNRKTLPPVCLFNFYLYMRDFERSSEEVDFWLDVTAHEVLWRLYVRATKRRTALAVAERERERVAVAAAAAAAAAEAEREDLAHVETDKWKSSLDEDHEQDVVKKTHQQQKPSVTLDMYEPHWSAANRYLEMSNNPSGTNSRRVSKQLQRHSNDGTLAQQHQQQHQHLKDKSSDPMLLQHMALSASKSPAPSNAMPLGSTSRTHYPSQLPGAIPSNWEMEGSFTSPAAAAAAVIMRSSSFASSHGGGSGAGPMVTNMMTSSSTIPFVSGGGAGGNGGSNSLLKAPSTLARAKSSSSAIAAAAEGNQGNNSSATPTAVKRASIPGVTRQDLFRSAERIYYKYLTPQAEKRVRIPGKGDEAEPGVSPLTEKSTGSSKVDAVKTPTTTTSTGGGGGTLGTSTTTTAVGATNGGRRKSNQSTKQLYSGMAVDQDLGLVFAEAREIVFAGMETYYFPRFIRARAYGNMALIPIFMGTMLCTSFQFNICPLMVVMQVSESKWMQFAKIKEPYIMMLHRQRGVKVVVVAILYTLCIGTLFGLLPGHRL